MILKRGLWLFAQGLLYEQERNVVSLILRLRLREPDSLIALTGGEMAYTREDGMKIILIDCLRD